MYLLVLKYYMFRVHIPASKERPQKNRRETTVRRVRAPMYVWVWMCMCVYVFVYMCMCVRASRVLKILLLLLLSSLLGLEGGYLYCGGERSLPKRHISLLCAPGTTLGDFLAKTRDVERKKTVIIFIYRFARSWRVRHCFFPRARKGTTWSGSPSLFLMRVFFYFILAFASWRSSFARGPVSFLL